ncbi:MAG: hypothetical protein IPK63_22720 [Candidatus Competibacteraceae bacterium]|nr:hypothetical protein [Candidatus Competibacteraceae bacterium]
MKRGKLRRATWKHFEHLAQDALELDRAGSPLGKPFLAVLKADVDRLGFLFGFGLNDPTDPKKIVRH